MRASTYLVLLAIFNVAISVSEPQCAAQEQGVAAERGEPRVEFRWIEPNVVDGLTEEWGRVIDCDSGKWFPHKKCILSSSDIQSIQVIESYSVFKPRYRYCLAFTLKESAVQTLIKTCGDENGKRLACVVVDDDGEHIITSPFLPNSYFDKRTPEDFQAPSSGSATKELTDKVLSAMKFNGRVTIKPSSWRKAE